MTKHKRDVILEFYSSPDAILNALHQAGWKIVPIADDQSFSELSKEEYDNLVRDAMAWRSQI